MDVYFYEGRPNLLSTSALNFVSIFQGKSSSWGYGFLGLPITILANLLLISSIMPLTKNDNKPIGLLIINSLGYLWTLFWFFVFVTVPQID